MASALAAATGLCLRRHANHSTANNYGPLPRATRTLRRLSIIISSAPVLWPSVRWQLKQLADLVSCWVARTLQLPVPLQESLLKLNQWVLYVSRVLHAMHVLLTAEARHSTIPF